MKYNKHYMQKHGNPDKGMPSLTRPGREDYVTHKGDLDYDEDGHRFVRRPYGNPRRGAASRTRPGREDYMTHKGDMYYDEDHHRFVKRPYGNPDDRDSIEYAGDLIVDQLRDAAGTTKTELKRLLRKSDYITGKDVDNAFDELRNADIIERFQRGWRLTADAGERAAMRVSRTFEDMADEFTNPGDPLDQMIAMNKSRARSRAARGNPVRNQVPMRGRSGAQDIGQALTGRALSPDPREAFTQGVRIGLKRGIELCGVRNLPERWRRLRELQDIAESEEEIFADQVLMEAGFVDRGAASLAQQRTAPGAPQQLMSRQGGKKR